MKTLFEKIQAAIANEIVLNFENEKDSWEISDQLTFNDVRVLSQSSKTLGNIFENVVFFQESDFHQTIGISLGANKIVTHINKSQYGNGNEDFELLEQAFNELWIHVSEKSKKIPQRKKSNV